MSVACSTLSSRESHILFSFQARKSLGTPKSGSKKDKENVSLSRSPHRKSLSHTPGKAPSAGTSSRPATPTVGVKTLTPRPRKSATPSSLTLIHDKTIGSSGKIPRPPTPISGPSPALLQSRRSSKQSPLSLYSITEENVSCFPLFSSRQ